LEKEDRKIFARFEGQFSWGSIVDPHGEDDCNGGIIMKMHLAQTLLVGGFNSFY